MGFPSGVDRVIEYILINYRWVFVCFFLLPASLLYEIYNYWRNWIMVKLNSAPKLHHRKVKHVQKQVSKSSGQWYGRREEEKPGTCPRSSGFFENKSKLRKKKLYQILKSIIFWDMTLCSPLSFNRRFGGTYRLHLQGRRNGFSKTSQQTGGKPRITWGHIPEDNILYIHRCENLKSYLTEIVSPVFEKIVILF
jgi:hypothetical protein